MVRPPRHLPSSRGEKPGPMPAMGAGFCRWDKSFRPPLNRASDTGLSILRLAVVRYMTARCIYSESAAGLVFRLNGLNAAGWLDGCWVWATSTICSRTVIYYANWAILRMLTSVFPEDRWSWPRRRQQKTDEPARTPCRVLRARRARASRLPARRPCPAAP